MSGRHRHPGVLHATERRDEQGSTLVELLVVMVLTTVVLAAVGTVFVSTTRSVRDTQVRTSTQADARTATEAISRSLRVAVTPPGPSASSPFVAASPTSVTFYASLQRSALTYTTTGPTAAPLVRASLAPPTLLTYALDTTRGCITEARTPATVNTGADAAATPYLWPAASTSTKCLARTTAAPSFTYFTSGVIASGAATPAPLTAVDGPPLTAGQAGSVVSVGVDLLVVDPAAPGVPGTRTSDRVTLVNVLASKAD